MHNILYRTYPETLTKERIENEVIDKVNHSGDGYGTDHITFYSAICENYDAAREYISGIDKDFYGGYAVKYYDFSGVKDSKKVDELKAKLDELHKKREEYINSHRVQNQKAAYIGCPDCGSKLNRERLRSQHCPLCGRDLRAISTLERIVSFDKRIKEAKEKIEAERTKQKSKAKIMWLVKFEYHS